MTLDGIEDQEKSLNTIIFVDVIDINIVAITGADLNQLVRNI